MTTQQEDRELLELAAKASGFHDKLLFSDIHDTAYWHDRYSGDWGEHDAAAEWNPLTDDGDAFRLAVGLGFVVYCPDDDDQSVVVRNFSNVNVMEVVAEDARLSTRRAIVRAAAEIGKSMP